MNLLFLLFLNLIIFSILSLLSYGLHKYNKLWFLRVNRAKFVVNNFYDKFILLEIKLPREINKSPQAMEFIIDAFYQTAGNPKDHVWDKTKGIFENFDKHRQAEDDKYKQGQVRLWMTLEIESRGGEIHFYIGTTQRFKEIISSYIFSQYPGIEVTQVDDYTDKIRPVLHGGEHDIWTGYYSLGGVKKDYLPIKTYIDYGLDKDPKDEFKIDPIIPLLESMANIKEDEHVWYQILIRAPIKDWKKDGQDRIDQILGIKRAKEDDKEKGVKKGDIIEQKKEVPKLSLAEKNEIELIDRNISKLGFDTQIEIIYIAPKGKLRPEGDQIVRNAMKSFNNQAFNTFTLNNQMTPNSFLDYTDKRIQENKKAGWFYLYVTRNPVIKVTAQSGTPLKDLTKKFKTQGYRRGMEEWGDFKEYFTHLDSKEIETGGFNTFVLNAEELATIYHFPSKAFSAPKFGRVESVKSEPPINLPI